MSWMAPDACTLPTAQQPLRVAEFDALFAAALRGLDRPAPTQLRLILDGAAQAQVRDLVAREAACCSFFTFTVESAAGGRLYLDVEVPPARVDVLDAVVARTAAHPGVSRSA